MSLNPPILDWTGRRVWLVGASTGIGAALARLLAPRGARLALSARGRERLDQLASGWHGALVLPLDVRDAAACERAAGEIERTWGGLDVVVVNAGTYEPVRAWQLEAEQARRMVEVNLLGAIHTVAAAVPRLLGQGSGALVLVASVAGYRGLPRSLIYGPTKAALINFAETLYLDLEPLGIGVFVVCPGFVKTPLTAQNEFKMPALIGPDEAAEEILAGLARGSFEIHFPKRFTRVMKLLRLVPDGLYFRAVRRMTGL